ncbi:hypothetical protein F66182_1094 [Fusarium sp. NRRL 66182]|nr:hypothetical protein F66182_1094 [Fusarium sp. NRRL 66182]
MLILIPGITGLVGQAVAQHALSQGHEVRGLGRNPKNLDSGLASRIESFVTCSDYFDSLSLAKAVKGVDAVISALPPVTSIVGAAQLALLLAAEKAGVKIFHAASWNMDWTKIEMGEHESYDAYKAFKRLAEVSSRLKPIYGFTGGIVEYMLVNIAAAGRPTLINKETQSLFHFGTGNEEFNFITVDDLAKYTLAAITDDEIISRGFYYVDSFRCSFREFAQVYGRMRGYEVKLVCLGDMADVEAQLAKARQEISPVELNKYIDLAYARLILDGKSLSDSRDCERWADRISPTGLEEWLKDHPSA